MPLGVQLFRAFELPPQQLPTEPLPPVQGMDRARQPDGVDLAYPALAEDRGEPDQLIAAPDQPGVRAEVDEIVHVVLDDVVFVVVLVHLIDVLGGRQEVLPRRLHLHAASVARSVRPRVAHH